MIKYIDSHAHYDNEAFDGDRDDLLLSLHKNGVSGIINIGCTLESSAASIELAERYDFIYAAVGIHPEEVSQCGENYLDRLREMCGHEKVAAVGEIGLDRHFKGYDREKQQSFFESQLKLALEEDLPVIIHTRDAMRDTVDILKKYRPMGVVHCFSGSKETAAEILSIGMYLGFTGAVTFPNAKRAAECIEMIPNDRILLETDCPFMAPVPFRGRRCDSGMAVRTLERIAELKNISVEEAADAVSENAARLFTKMKLI